MAATMKIGGGFAFVATAQQVDRRYKSDQARQKSKSLTGIKLVRHLVLATPY
jgi:hypothetical protein